MKNIILISMMLFLASISCNNNQKTKDQDASEIKSEETMFPKGKRRASDWFTGKVFVQGLVSTIEIEDLYNVGGVTFEPRGKTLWHTYPTGQVLFVTEGEGWY